MNGNETVQDPMEGLRDLCSAEMWGMEVSTVSEPPRRFEAGFFASEGYRAVDAMHHSGFDVETIGDYSQVRWFGPFARKYVTDPNHGCPFLTSSTMMEARPRAEKLVSIKHTKHLEALKIYENDILISCSGTIGNSVLCTKDVDGWACSQDAIRVTVNEPDHLGMVYCFLQSPIGQFLIQKSQTGSVVRHIYEADVTGLPIPRLPRALREVLTHLIKKASSLRVEANRLLNEAEEAVYAHTLTKRPSSKQNIDGPEVSSESLRRLRSTGEYKGNLRLDATAFRPATQKLRYSLIDSGSESLGKLVSEVLYIGKVYRIPIDDADRGAHLLSGKDLVFIRPEKDKVLSVLNSAHIRRCLLKRGMILVSRSGTPGRVSIVHRNYEGFVGSEHILRIVPNDNRLDPYYLYAFLSCEAGQQLMGSLVYGSVILTLSKEQLESIPVPIPPDGGRTIGNLTRNAFDARADAEEAEDQAFNLFMTAVTQGRNKIESEWGGEY